MKWPGDTLISLASAVYLARKHRLAPRRSNSMCTPKLAQREAPASLVAAGGADINKRGIVIERKTLGGFKYKLLAARRHAALLGRPGDTRRKARIALSRRVLSASSELGDGSRSGRGALPGSNKCKRAG